MTQDISEAHMGTGNVHRPLSGKVAIVSGGARGMGAAHVRKLVQAGARVVAGDIDIGVDVDIAEQYPGAVEFLHLDVTSVADWTAAVDRATELYGPVDILVNNAGLSVGGGVDLDSYDMTNFRKTVEVDFFGVVNGMKAVLPQMRAAGRGSIINIGSIAGLNGWYKNAAYAASKAAVNQITKSVALEVAADGVRVNAVHPGVVDTPMTSTREFLTDHIAMKRKGTPGEISEAVLFLASDASSFVTGAGIVVDGGESAGRPMLNYRAWT